MHAVLMLHIKALGTVLQVGMPVSLRSTGSKQMGNILVSVADCGTWASTASMASGG